MADIGGTETTTVAGGQLAAALAECDGSFAGVLAASESVRVDDLSEAEFAALERAAAAAEAAGRTVGEWDAYVAAAGNVAAAQERIEEAVEAGVDFAELLAAQAERTGS